MSLTVITIFIVKQRQHIEKSQKIETSASVSFLGELIKPEKTN